MRNGNILDQFTAHTRDDGQKQTIAEHSLGVKRVAEEFSIDEFREMAGYVAYIHDIGKIRDGFQRRIEGLSQQLCEHACCAAKEIKHNEKSGKFFSVFAPMMEYCTAGHHTGLQNGMPTEKSPEVSLYDSLNRSIPDIEKYGNFIDELCTAPDDGKFESAFRLLQKGMGDIENEDEQKKEFIERYAFFTRYLFSCLTDADYLDTERFCQDGLERGLKGDFAKALELVCSELASNRQDTEVCRARSRLQEQAFNVKLNSAIGILNMPTGSGKTLCSIKIALEQAIKNGKKRIIYVIPYTSIIDQTADEFERIFEKALPVLQHHSNYIFDDEYKDELDSGLLARCTENWDAPLIITTNVQFFQSIYHNRSSKLRKLHNMADSVIIFDEVHMMPVEYLQPCLRGVGYLLNFLNCEALFLSATMPDFSELLNKYAIGCRYTDMITDKADFRYFRNCVCLDIGEVGDECLLMKAQSYQSSLIIVNSLKKALELYEKCTCENCFCLSAYVTSDDRSEAIKKIKELINKEPVTVISTSLIEAGVDLDFEAVFRELAGLDSIIQSAGRCNREGRRAEGFMHIFTFENIKNLQGKDIQKNKGIKIAANISKDIMRDYEDIFCPECIKDYYHRLYEACKSYIDNETIYRFPMTPVSIPFRDYAESFNFIDSDTVNVIIPNDKNAGLIESLEYSSKGLRALARDSAVLHYGELHDLLDKGIVAMKGTAYVLAVPEYYSPETGLNTEYELNTVV